MKTNLKVKLKKRDFKIGLLVIGTFFIVYFGLNFLKGINIFTPANYYYAQYEDVDGLVNSSPVHIKGYKVGYVDEILYDFSKPKAFTVKISVLKNVHLPLGTRMQLCNDGLIGGKVIQLLIPEANLSNSFHTPGDTLESNLEKSIIQGITDQVLPKFDSLFQDIDSLIQSLLVLTENPSLANSLKSLETTTSNFSQSSVKINSLLSSEVPQLIKSANNTFTDLNSLSENLSKINFAKSFSELDSTLVNIKKLTEKINSKENSLGLLMNDKELYNNIISITENVDSLMVDIKNNPKRYVHFSVFGKKK